MGLELVLAVAIQQSNPRVKEPTAKKYAAWVMEEATTHSLDPWLFQALVHKETRWTPGAVRHEGDGSCSVGLGQINVKCDDTVVAPLRDARTNLRRMGVFLHTIRGMCRTKCEDLGWLRAYNPGSHAYLVDIQEAVKKYHADSNEPDFLQVQLGLHASRVLWQTACGPGDECRLVYRVRGAGRFFAS